MGYSLHGNPSIFTHTMTKLASRAHYLGNLFLPNSDGEELACAHLFSCGCLHCLLVWSVCKCTVYMYMYMLYNYVSA